MEIRRYKLHGMEGNEKASYLFSYEHGKHLQGYGLIHVGTEPKYKNAVLKHNQKATIFINSRGNDKYAQIKGKKEHIESAKNSLEIATGIRLEEHK
jgi:hypothetical protein